MGKVSLGSATTSLKVENAQLEVQIAAATERATKLEAEVAAVTERAAAEKAERQEEFRLALQNLEATFESTSNRVLKQTVTDFSQNQAQVLQQRDETLKATLTPLETQLKQYRDMLETLAADVRRHLELAAAVLSDLQPQGRPAAASASRER